MPETVPYKIRFADLNDKYDILYLGKKFIKEAELSRLGYDPKKAEELFERAITGDDFCLIVMEHDGAVVGLLVGFVMPSFFSNVRQAGELMWYVDAPHRGSKMASKMVDAYEDCAKNNGAVLCTMVNIDMLNGDKVAKFYKNRGYKLTENTFVKEL